MNNRRYFLLASVVFLFPLLSCAPSQWLARRSDTPASPALTVEARADSAATERPAATSTRGPEPTATDLRAVDTPVKPTATIVEPTSVVVVEPTITPDLPSAEVDAWENLVAGANGGRVVWASDELDENPATNLIDGKKSDFHEWWSSKPPELPQVIVFALAGDEEYVIDTVVLNPFTTEWRFAWVQDFEVYVSTDSTELKDMGWVGSATLERVGIDQTFTFDPVRARYVALVITSQYGSIEGVTLNEFEVYAADPGTEPVEPVRLVQTGNLVAARNGGTIVHYSTEDGSGNYPVDNLIDGADDTETGWSSAEDTENAQYVVFSFPGNRPYLVGRVVLNPYSDRYEEDWTQDFEIWGSDVSANLEDMWQLGSFWLAQNGRDQSFSFEPEVLRYIAFVPTSNYGGTEYALNEFEVYQPGDWTNLSPDNASAEASLPEDKASGAEGFDEDALEEPDVTFIPGALNGRPLDAGSSQMDNIEFEIQVSDLLPFVYHLYGQKFDSLMQVTLTNNNPEPAKVWIGSSVTNYTDQAVDTVVLQPGETLVVAQNPPLLPTALDLLHDRREATLHLEVDYLLQGEKRLIYEGTSPVTVYSRQDKMLGAPGIYAARYYAATMVTPNDPALDELLRVAADYHPDGQIVWGYGDETDSTGQVWNNLKALYDAVGDYYDVTYVAVGLPFVSLEDTQSGLYLQRVKLPFEVLESHSGMCIELAQLFASAFEKILLDPVIVTVPGHAYVGVPMSRGSTIYYFVEATMVGSASFEDAVQVGGEEFMNEAKEPIDADVYDDFYWMDISQIRREGVWPIPWR